MRLPGIGLHPSALDPSDEWLTPPAVLDALGGFDLDPCNTPGNWTGAARSYTIEDDGLTAPWEGRVWLNPPYSDADRWIRRLAAHGTGTALVFARTETAWWFESVWPKAEAVMFLRGRLHFHRPDGTATTAGPAPSALIAYGSQDRHLLASSGLDGTLVTEWTRTARTPPTGPE